MRSFSSVPLVCPKMEDSVYAECGCNPVQNTNWYDMFMFIMKVIVRTKKWLYFHQVQWIVFFPLSSQICLAMRKCRCTIMTGIAAQWLLLELQKHTRELGGIQRISVDNWWITASCALKVLAAAACQVDLLAKEKVCILYLSCIPCTAVTGGCHCTVLISNFCFIRSILRDQDSDFIRNHVNYRARGSRVPIEFLFS